MKKRFTVLGAGLILAFTVSLAGTPGAYDYYRFKTGDFPMEREKAEIERTIEFFSSTISGFYATGGSIAGLNIFPAEKPVKHRIFQDIDGWMKEGKLFVMDRDKSNVKEVDFIKPDLAAAVVDEDWFCVFQDAKTRRQITMKKADLITVRYFMKKLWGRWIVADYEVFARGDDLPPLPPERLAQ